MTNEKKEELKMLKSYMLLFKDKGFDMDNLKR